MARFISSTVKLALLGVAIGLFVQPVSAQQTGLLVDLFGGKSSDSKSSSDSSKEKKSTSSSGTRRSNETKQASTKEKTDLITALSGKTPEERAKAEAERKKAAEIKARDDARKDAAAAEEKRKSDLVKAKADAKEAAMAAAEKKKKDEEKAREVAAREKQKAIDKSSELAKKEQLEAERGRQMAEKQRADDARKQALVDKRLADEKARELLLQARQKEEERRRDEDEVLSEQRMRDTELVDRAQGRKKQSGGFFGSLFRGSNSSEPTSQEVQSVASPPNRYLYINEREISSLNSANSKIEIDLGDQRLRVFREKVLVIETQVSSGRSGFATPTGHYSIQEMLLDKRSGRFGTWYNSSGVELNGDDIRNPPSGASRFVGAEMPYWLRITGGIGMHIGYVPDGPASHGCIRVPSNIQPLIYSKVKVGTPVSIR